MTDFSPRRQGFTLLEIAIVVVIIAIITGGILTADTLIRAAHIRAIVSEYDQYAKATREFFDKYQALPGDMSNAESLWGTDGTCPNTTYIDTPLTTTLVCDGNGDGQIGYCTGGMSCTASLVPEIWQAWKQLSVAGFVNGRYTGRPGSTATTRAEVGLNVPASTRVPGGWTLMYYLNPVAFSGLKTDQYGHVLLFGGDKGGYNAPFTTEPVLFVKEAYELDKKVDDGYPEMGKLRAWKNYWLPSTDPGPTADAATSYCYQTVGGVTQYYIYNDQRTYTCSMLFILDI